MNACRVCGIPIPDGQSGICSTCYGDPEWGSDGYLRATLQRGAELAAEQDAAAQERSAEEEGRAKLYDPAI